MRVLVTRPRPDADETARLLAAAGHDPVVAPLLDIVFDRAATLDLRDTQALLVTSANGARALAAASARRDLPVYAVGAASAEAAHAAGFADVTSADGDVSDLAALVVGACDPGAGPLVHAAGSVAAGDLAGRLAAEGFTVTRAVLYGAEPAAALPEAAATGLRDATLDAVMFYSPRTAAAFVELVNAAGFADRCAGLVACCLSKAVAEAAAALPFAEVRVAARPDQPSLLALL